MFIGEYSHNLDDKGRLAIPAKFRSLLKGGAVVTRGLDNCLFLYPKKQWNELAGKFKQLVEVLTRVAEQTTLPVAEDVCALYQRLMRNPDSVDLTRRLLEQGFLPIAGAAA